MFFDFIARVGATLAGRVNDLGVGLKHFLKRRKFVQSISIFLILFFVAGSNGLVLAQESGDTVNVSPIMVTATRTERALEEIPISVSVIGEQELRRSPQLDIASQVAEVPGITIHGQTGVGAARRVLIRGMGGYRTLILINGVRQTYLRGADGSFYSVDPSNIERIEVIKGPASVLYGPEAIGGVINIITKTAQRQDNDKPVGAYIGGIYDGSTEGFEPKAAIFGRYKGFSYRIAGSGVNAKDRRIPHDRVWHSSFTNRNYNGNLAYDWGGGSVSFMFDENQATHETILTKNLGGGLYVPAKLWETRSTSVSLTPKQDRRSYTGTFELRQLTEYLKRITVSGFYQKQERINGSDATIYHATYRPGSKISRIHNDHESVGGSVQSEWTFGINNVILGFDYDKSDFSSQEFAYNAAGVVNPGLKLAGYQKTIAIFGQNEIKFGDFALTLGLRENWFELALEHHSQLPNRVGSVKENKLVGSVGLVWSGIENLYLRALYSQGYRNPNLLQKFMGMPSVMMNVIPNPNLKPETSDNYEIGARYNNGTLNMDLALFYNELTDGISTQEVVGSPNTYEYINFDKVKVSGVEFEIDYKFHNIGLKPYASLSLLTYRTINKKNGFKTNHNGQPSRWGKIGLKWEGKVADSTLMFADLNAVMSGGAHIEYADGTNTAWRKAFQTANLSFGFEGSTSIIKYNTSISLRNIFNQHYNPVSPSPMPEPGFHVVASFGFEY